MTDKNPAGRGYVDPLNREQSLDERSDAREQLRRSVDELTHRTNVYAQMQKDPLKMIGGASGVGLVLGLLLGARLKRTKVQRIYVDAYSSEREQKALEKAQLRALKGKGGRKGGGLGHALFAALSTMALKVAQERFITPQLEQLANRYSPQGESSASAGASQRPHAK